MNLTPTKSIPRRERLIVALDLPNITAARALVEQLGEAVLFYKIGLELFVAKGCFDFVEWLGRQGKRVFVDLKFFLISDDSQLRFESWLISQSFCTNKGPGLGGGAPTRLWSLVYPQRNKGHAPCISPRQLNLVANQEVL